MAFRKEVIVTTVLAETVKDLLHRVRIGAKANRDMLDEIQGTLEKENNILATPGEICDSLTRMLLRDGCGFQFTLGENGELELVRWQLE